jgi:hypothetical protein
VPEEFVTVCVHAAEPASLAAASRSVDTALLILPYSETVVWIAVAFVCSAASGCRSMAISWLTIEFTSRPLPMPAELIVAMGQASCYAPTRGGADADVSAAAERT